MKETLSDDESAVRLQRLDKSFSAMESKRKKLTDMLLDDKITKEADMLDKSAKVIFASIVDKVIVGDISEDSTIDPYRLTFVLKGMEDRVVSDAKNRYRNLKKKVV